MVVDASREFVTLVVYNNRSGPDRRILRQFKKSAWNNPVVRFLEVEGRDIIPRRDGIWTTGALFKRMAEALLAGKRPVLQHVRVAALEYGPSQPEIATFAMYCYWEGKKQIGAIDGVPDTRIGMLEQPEVVEVKFDASVIDFRSLVKRAHRQRFAGRIFARTDEQIQVAKQVIGEQAVKQSDRRLDANTQSSITSSTTCNTIICPSRRFKPRK